MVCTLFVDTVQYSTPFVRVRFRRSRCLFYSPWLCGNSLPLPSLPSVPFRSRPRPLPLEVPPLRLRRLGERISSSSSNVFWCILGINLHPFDYLITNNFLSVLSIKRKFPWHILIHCPGRKKVLEHTIWQPFGGIASFFFGGGNSPTKKMSGIIATITTTNKRCVIVNPTSFFTWNNALIAKVTSMKPRSTRE